MNKLKHNRGEWYIGFNGDLVITDFNYNEVYLRIPKDKIKEFLK